MHALLDTARTRLVASENVVLGAAAAGSLLAFVVLLFGERVHPLVVYALQVYLAF